MTTDGRIIYAPIMGATIPADATSDVFNVIGTSAIRIRMHGWEITSDAVAATLTTLTFGFASTVGSTGSALVEQHAEDGRTTTILGVAVSDADGVGTDAGRIMGYQWEQLGPVGHIWTPEMRPLSVAAEGFSLQLTTAAGFACSGWLCWEEVYV